MWLSELGADVYGLSRKPAKQHSFFTQLRLTENITRIESDVLNLDEIKKAIKDVKPDFLFHLAAQPIVSNSYTNPINTFNVNCIGTANVLEALRGSNHNCVAIIVSTDKCYENKETAWSYQENDRLGGKDPYSASKSIVEIIVKSYHSSFFSNSDSNVKIGAVRSGNLIGGGDWARDRIIPDCVMALNSNKVLELKDPHATRPWQHVLDSLNGYLKVGQCLLTNDELNGEAFNFGPDSTDHTVLNLITEFVNHWKGLAVPEPYYIVPENEQLIKETYALNLNCEKAARVLEWKPLLEFKESVRYTANWYNDYYKNSEGVLEFTKRQIHEFGKLIGHN